MVLVIKTVNRGQKTQLYMDRNNTHTRDDKLFCLLIIKISALFVKLVLYSLHSAETVVTNWNVNVVLIIVYFRSQLLLLCVHDTVITAVHVDS